MQLGRFNSQEKITYTLQKVHSVEIVLILTVNENSRWGGKSKLNVLPR